MGTNAYQVLGVGEDGHIHNNFDNGKFTANGAHEYMSRELEEDDIDDVVMIAVGVRTNNFFELVKFLLAQW